MKLFGPLISLVVDLLVRQGISISSMFSAAAGQRTAGLIE